MIEEVTEALSEAGIEHLVGDALNLLIALERRGLIIVESGLGPAERDGDEN